MKLISVSKSYGDNVVFDKFCLEAEEKKILAVLGSSGCGKTTLLNIISGLTDFQGAVEKSGNKISYIFQNKRLLPNLTVYKNIEFVLKNVYSKDKIPCIIDEILRKVELYESRDLYPSELSGGMGQRVSLARAFAYPSDILLMDEPFKALDISLKKRIIETFNSLYRTDRRTTVFVTHDIEEAFAVADRIIVLQKGGNILADETLSVPAEERGYADFSETKKRIYDVL